MSLHFKTEPFKDEQTACVDIDNLMKALCYLSSSPLSGNEPGDVFFKKVPDNWELKDIIVLLNIIHALGGVLLNLVRVRSDYKQVQSILADIHYIFDRYEVTVKEEEN